MGAAPSQGPKIAGCIPMFCKSKDTDRVQFSALSVITSLLTSRLRINQVHKGGMIFSNIMSVLTTVSNPLQKVNNTSNLPRTQTQTFHSTFLQYHSCILLLWVRNAMHKLHLTYFASRSNNIYHISWSISWISRELLNTLAPMRLDLETASGMDVLVPETRCVLMCRQWGKSWKDWTFEFAVFG